MHLSSSRHWAAFSFPLLTAIAVSAATASAQDRGIEIPFYRNLAAAEPMVTPGQNGTDASANPRSLAGLNLLATIPAPTAPRRGYFVQAQCTAGLTVAFDDAAGALTSTIIVLDGPASDGGQGGSLDMSGIPHTGRIRIYSSNANCQMAARAW